jgi:hypothetical protein
MLKQFDEPFALDIFQSFYDSIDRQDKLGTDLEDTLVYGCEGNLERFNEALWEIVVTAVIKFGFDIKGIRDWIATWADQTSHLAQEYQSLKARGLIN